MAFEEYCWLVVILFLIEIEVVASQPKRNTILLEEVDIASHGVPLGQLHGIGKGTQI